MSLLGNIFKSKLKHSLLSEQLKFSTIGYFSKAFLSTTKNSKSEKQSSSMDYLKANPYYSKYEDKLKTVVDQNPGLLESTFGKKSGTKLIKKDSVTKSRMEYSLTKKRDLNSIMKMDMLENHGKSDVKKIWMTYMNDKSRLGDVLSSENYEILIKRSEQFKTFIFPLPRANSGYEFIMCQWSNNECHLTPLINFQAYGENAPTAMTIVYFDDLVREKDLNIVLVMTEFDDKMLNREDAKLLMDLIKLYYLNNDENDEKYRLMKMFTEKPNEFKHMDLIKQWEIERDKGFRELD